MSAQIPTSMRSLAISDYCTPDKYEIATVPTPTITNASDVLIKVHAASINPVDVKLASGIMRVFASDTFPFKLAYDLSGTVVATGTEAATLFPIGTEVYGRVPEQNRGTASDYALCPADALARKPASLSHAAAASIPLATLTSLQTLEMGNAKLPGGLGGKTVFLPGALSGTGASAVQLAKRVFGVARVITTLSPGKICKAGHLLGEDVLDRVIDYTAEEAGKAIEAGSVDFMYDNMGGAAMASLHLMKKGGVIVSVSGLPKGTAIKRIMPRMPWVVEKAINGVFWVSQMRAARYGVFYDCLLMRPSGSDLKRLAGWIEEGKLRPVVGRTASFTDLEDVRKGCQEVYDAKGGVGKFVIEIVEDGRR